jgi:hypothetical protein
MNLLFFDFGMVQHGIYAYDSWEDKDSTVEELPL